MGEILVKTGEEYILYSKDKTVLGITSGTIEGRKLSKQNCEDIERGYDLENLSRERLSTRFNENSGYHKFVFVEAYKEGFLKAMEILGDKKFTEKELAMLFAYGHQIGMNDVLAIQSQHSPQPMPKPDSDKLRDELIQSLQQTEWDVESEIELYHDGDFIDDGKTHIIEAKLRPRLDSDGCLILKRI